ncbi:ABC transporter ATP-binding protein/permease [Microbacterium sp.]|uniref:ABC transporter ATP-binding protein/permease n=1 Tax=Microbacterium sp. TaxID=51671 RepID=UPI0039E2598A
MARRGFQGAVMRSFGARDHRITVTGKEHLAPHFLRVRMHSDTVFEDAVPDPTAWLRFWFPDPEGSDVEFQRGYTFSEADEASGDFSIDFVLHEPAGPASAWALSAQPGDEVAAMSMGSTRFVLPEELPAGYLLIGDSAAVPAINTILPVIPAQVPIELYLEEHHPDDHRIPLASHPMLAVHWVPRGDGSALAAGIETRDWSNWSAWLAGESTTLKHVRARLRDDFGFPKGEITAQAYWIHGRAMGKRRDGEKEQAAGAAETLTSAQAEETAASVPVAAESVTAPAASEPAASEPTASEPATAPSAPAGRWRSQAAGRLLAPLKGTLIAAGVVQGVVTVLQLAPFVLLVELARLLLAGAEAQALWTVGILAAALLALGALLESALLLWMHAVDARFERDLRRRLLDKLSRLRLGWFAERGSGGVKGIVQDDTLGLHYLVTHAIPDAVSAVIAPIAVLVYMFVVDWRLGLVLFLPVLVYIVSMWVMVIQSGAKIGQAQRWAERMNDEAGAYLAGQQIVRVFGGAAGSSFRRRLDGYIAFLGEWQRPFIGAKTVMDLANRPGTYLWLIALFGTLLVATGGMDPVSLLPFLLLGTTFGARLLGIGYGLSGIRDGILAARRIGVVLDETELDVRPGTPAEGVSAGRVEFDGVRFEYRPGVPVLKDVTAVLEPGTVTALVGPSGSGKSTLAGLLARFHDVTGGAVRIGGDDVRSLDADELYRRVGFVFQDAQIVHATVHENIALAVPDADRAAVEAAARAARLHERIQRMPEGYDTVLGPDAALSGGERQRLTIARALLADAPVLVLDEATAFADPESEYQVQRAIDELTRGRTVLVIAHRLHTITGVDRILVLEQGELVESGTHAELLEAGGAYRRLWDARVSGGVAGDEERTSEVTR